MIPVCDSIVVVFVQRHFRISNFVYNYYNICLENAKYTNITQIADLVIRFKTK